MKMKTIILAGALLLLGSILGLAQLVPEQQVINLAGGTAPSLLNFQANAKEYEWRMLSGNSAVVLSNRTPVMYWAPSATTTSGIIQASVTIVNATAGVFRATFIPSQLNYVTATGMYGVGYSTTAGVTIARQGIFRINPDPFASGQPAIVFSLTNIVWGAINWIGLPDFALQADIDDLQDQIDGMSPGGGTLAGTNGIEVVEVPGGYVLGTVSNWFYSRFTTPAYVANQLSDYLHLDVYEDDKLTFVSRSGSNTLSGKLDILDSPVMHQNQTVKGTNFAKNIVVDDGTSESTVDTAQKPTINKYLRVADMHGSGNPEVQIIATTNAVGVIMEGDNGDVSILWGEDDVLAIDEPVRASLAEGSTIHQSLLQSITDDIDDLYSAEITPYTIIVSNGTGIVNHANGIFQRLEVTTNITLTAAASPKTSSNNLVMVRLDVAISPTTNWVIFATNSISASSSVDISWNTNGPTSLRFDSPSYAPAGMFDVYKIR